MSRKNQHFNFGFLFGLIDDKLVVLQLGTYFCLHYQNNGLDTGHTLWTLILNKLGQFVDSDTKQDFTVLSFPVDAL